jgi:O-antigen ligase
MFALQGKIEEMPLDSTGIRLRSWYFAGEYLAEKPWFGWGPDGSKLIMKESSALPLALKPQFGHLHNTYLDIIAQFGIFGLTLYLALLAWLIIQIIKAFETNTISLSTFLFGIAFIIYWTIINIFESYMLFSSGKYAFTIVFSGIISLSISSEPPAGPNQISPLEPKNHET